MELEFGPGITAIVGPNGSGKSNIADGIRWALGEQSVKYLRGAKMEDVIFAGSAKRRALGVAEVSLTFDNSDGMLPVDYREVIVTRRIFRSGESEYFINKNNCRLKDIQDLLADTGLGKEAMTVIGQNKIDEILNSKPEERRLLFEEAAGITKYKLRKKEALRKLEDTSENLIRVKDIITEIEAQLEPLRQSAERTEKYNILAERLISCKVTMLINRLDRFREMLGCAKSEFEKLQDEQTEYQTKLSLREAEGEKLTIELSGNVERLATVEQNINESSTLIERLDGQVGVLSERLAQYNNLTIKNENDSSDITNQLNNILVKCKEIDDNLAIKVQKKNDIDNIISQQQEKYNEIACSITSFEQLLEKEKEQTFDRMQGLVACRNELRTAERDLEYLIVRFGELDSELEDTKLKLFENHNLAIRLNEDKNNLQQIIKENNELKQKLLADEKHKEEFEAELLKRQAQTKDEYTHISSRYKVLSSMQKDYEGFGKGIRTILKSNLSWRSSICGAVAEILDVPEAYLTAVEMSLGGALQYIVTEDETTAKHAISYLKQTHSGRATFLPLNTIRPIAARDYELEAAMQPGAVGIASQLVSCDVKYRKVIDFLLGRTIVVKQIDDGLRIAKKYDYRIKIVTLGGELINPGGSMTGGSSNKRDTSFLSRSAEIEQLSIKAEALLNKLDTISYDIKTNQDELKNIKAMILELDEKRKELDIKLAEINVHIERTSKDEFQLNLTLRTIDDEKEILQNKKQQLEKQISDYQQKISEAENQDILQKNQLSELKLQLKKYIAGKDELSLLLTESKVTQGALLQEISNLSLNAAELKAQASQLEERLKTINENQIKLKNEIIQINREKQEIEQKRCQQIKIKEELIILRNQLYKDKTAILSNQSSNDKDIKELRRKLNFIQSRLHEVELMTAKYQYEVENISEQLVKNFSLSEQDARKMLLTLPENDIQSSIHKLEQEIAELGPINHQAIEEYKRLNDRYVFLVKQSEDLLSARDYLNTVIKDIDKNMSVQFQQAFTQINKYFKDIFCKLFGGGSAELKLLEPTDILETGVDIVVQPPGKKLQNLALLSGGERALAVIGLLFALLTYRPAPFCVLDEVDAALDEANVERFSTFLKQYSVNTQFIVVTHRKGTMEASDIMYGVTMEDAGISKLLSVKFIENAG